MRRVCLTAHGLHTPEEPSSGIAFHPAVYTTLNRVTRPQRRLLCFSALFRATIMVPHAKQLSAVISMPEGARHHKQSTSSERRGQSTRPSRQTLMSLMSCPCFIPPSRSNCFFGPGNSLRDNSASGTKVKLEGQHSTARGACRRHFRQTRRVISRPPR